MPGTWKVTGNPRRLTTGTGLEIGATVAATGHLAFASINRNVDIWSLPVEADNGKVKGELERLTADAAADQSPSLSADGNTLVFESNRAGNFHIWRKDLRSRKETVLTMTSSAENAPVISPDGTQVAYMCVQDRKPGICVLSLRDGTADRIFDNYGVTSDWSQDGRSILFRAGSESVGLLDTVSRKTSVLLGNEKHAAFNSRLSPDGRWIAFNISAVKQQVIVAPARPGSPPPESDRIALTDSTSTARGPAWSPNGNLLYFTSDRDGFHCIWAQQLVPATKRPDGQPFAVYHVHNTRRALHNISSPRQFGLSAVSGRLVFANAEITGNIWMLDAAGKK
jgi:Tol biopolymer transport system component